MKVYELKLQKGGRGVFKVSLVKGPAVDATLLKFSKEKEQILTFADEEKRIIYSVAMRPDINIFRKDVNGEPALVTYDKEFVEESQINFFRNNGNKSTNIDHADTDTEGVFLFESWIVKDPELDKSKTLKLETFAGDWILGYKIDNDEIWNDYLKTGKLDGLSIEATNLEHIFKNEITMKKHENKVLAFIREGLNKIFTDAEKFEEEIAEVSKWWNTVVNDTFEIGDVVERKPSKDSDDDPTPISAGEYELKDGRRILTDKEGVIRFIFPAAGAESTEPTEPTETEEEKMKREKIEKMADETDEEKTAREAKEAADAKALEDAKDDADEPTEKEKKLMDEIVDLKQEIAELKAEKVKDETELETMKKEVVEMKKQTPAAEAISDLPIVPAVPAKDYKNMSNLEKLKFNREN